MIVAPDILCQVEGEPFPADSSLGCQASLEVAPESLQPIDMTSMTVTKNLAVIHQPVNIASSRDPSITTEGVGANCRSYSDTLAEQWQQSLGLHIRDYFSPHLSPSTEDAENSLLGSTTASPRALATFCSASVFPSSSAIGLVALHYSREYRRKVLGPGFADQKQGPQNPPPF